MNRPYGKFIASLFVWGVTIAGLVGNPEGDEGMAGTDPGLLFTRKILKIDQFSQDNLYLGDSLDDNAEVKLLNRL